MFKKLLKHDMRRLAPFFGILFLTIAVSTVVGSVLSYFMNDFQRVSFLLSDFFGLILALTVFILISSFAAAAFYLIYRFYRSLYTDEGYLTFTLPAKTSSIIWSKFLSSFIWISLTGILLSVCYVCFIAVSAKKSFASVINGFAKLFKSINSFSDAAFLIEVILLIISGLSAVILSVMLVVTLGSVSSKKHPILMSVLIWLGFSLLRNFLYTIAIFMAGSNVSMIFFYSNDRIWTAVHFLMIFFILLNLIFAAVEYFLTNLVLTKHLNLK